MADGMEWQILGRNSLVCRESYNLELWFTRHAASPRTSGISVDRYRDNVCLQIPNPNALLK